MAPAMVRTRCIPTNRWALKAIHDWGMLPGILSDLRPGPGPRAPGGCGNVRAQVSLVPESSAFSSLEGIFIGRPPSHYVRTPLRATGAQWRSAQGHNCSLHIFDRPSGNFASIFMQAARTSSRRSGGRANQHRSNARQRHFLKKRALRACASLS